MFQGLTAQVMMVSYRYHGPSAFVYAQPSQVVDISSIVLVRRQSDRKVVAEKIQIPKKSIRAASVRKFPVIFLPHNLNPE